MNTRVALWLGGIILAVFIADEFYFGWDLWIEVMRVLWQISTWMAFWR
ncbi:hypothetical protein [Roseobacter sp. HKCCA0434]|nr:hypothetical protein [Roseobacter sp. HKCCA0434]